MRAAPPRRNKTPSQRPAQDPPAPNPKDTRRQVQRERRCFNCGQPGHLRASCPTAGGSADGTGTISDGEQALRNRLLALPGGKDLLQLAEPAAPAKPRMPEADVCAAHARLRAAEKAVNNLAAEEVDLEERLQGVKDKTTIALDELRAARQAVSEEAARIAKQHSDAAEAGSLDLTAFLRNPEIDISLGEDFSLEDVRDATPDDQKLIDNARKELARSLGDLVRGAFAGIKDKIQEVKLKQEEVVTQVRKKRRAEPPAYADLAPEGAAAAVAASPAAVPPLPGPGAAAGPDGAGDASGSGGPDKGGRVPGGKKAERDKAIAAKLAANLATM